MLGHPTNLSYGRARDCSAHSRCGIGGLFFYMLVDHNITLFEF